MSWFSQWNRERHLRKYARCLYPKLKHLYGGGKFFTEAQIRRAASEARLDQTFLPYGLAMFLPQGEFERIHPDLSEQDYLDKRALVASVFGYDAAIHGSPARWDLGDSSDLAGGGDGGGAGDGDGG